MYVLTKFFEKKSYQNDFVSGNWYLSSLSAFTKTYAERGLREAAMNGDKEAKELLRKQQNNSQRDIFEGTMASVTPDQVPELPNDFRDSMCTDIMIRALGYNYCNLMCFCKIGYYQPWDNGQLMIDWEEPNMKMFGDYAVIIKDPEELFRRIDVAIQKQGYQYICGDVNYHPMTFKNGLAEHKHSMTLSIKSPIEIENILERSKRIDYDAFDKCDVYKAQNEWRLAVNNYEADKEPLRLNVGNLSDIVVKVKREGLADKLTKLLLGFKIHSMKEGYFGNISRDEMREAFYQMGGYKGFLMCTIG